MGGYINMSFLSAFLGTVTCELKIFIRSSSTPALVALILGLCMIVLPGPDANYTIVSFASAKPIMTVDVYLVTAGVILSTILFPYYLLNLGTLQTRDRTLCVDEILMRLEHLKLIIAMGRIAASSVKVLVFSLLLSLFLSFTFLAKLGQFPSVHAQIIFFLLLVPSGLLAIAPAMLLEQCFLGSRNMKIIVALVLWLLSLLVYNFVNLDFYGFSALASSLPLEYTGRDMAFGIIAGNNLSKFEWFTLPELSKVLELSMTNLLYSFISLLLPILLVKHKTSAQNNRKNSIKSKAFKVNGARILSEDLASRESKSNFLSSIFIELSRLISSNALYNLIAVIVFILCLAAPNATQVIIPLILSALFFIFRSHKMTLDKSVKAMELAFSALQFPNPQLMRVLAIVILLTAPLLPLFFNIGLERTIVLMSAIILCSSWLILTFQKWGRPLLGVVIFTLYWYVFGLTSTHDSFDLLAIHYFSLSALICNSLLAIIVLLNLFNLTGAMSATKIKIKGYLVRA
ncbi:hypothetical protein [Idiomarina sp. HP20-50]|uniref:hypothetical protein n=1 Tax=Idiomarina sp. HP20-50 TaxID=3070813 RepID=UPI00294ADBFA|nr:hypothetical protein [Idiomarina sp. HP20-50]MDV6316264.1 hypothetical protein [Idiomarina sp. HP20-50]